MLPGWPRRQFLAIAIGALLPGAVEAKKHKHKHRGGPGDPPGDLPGDPGWTWEWFNSCRFVVVPRWCYGLSSVYKDVCSDVMSDCCYVPQTAFCTCAAGHGEPCAG